MYVDVHTHLTHEKFNEDLDAVIQRAIAAGLQAMVVNGLEPTSNRQILDLAEKHKQIVPALGIYPIDAINGLVADLPFPVAKFDVDQEIDFIAKKASEGAVKAIGECGLDGYWVGEETFAEQERVFLRLIEVSCSNDIPLIIHTRKLERRSIEILEHHKVNRVNFHCFGGKVKLALKAAETNGWYFSIGMRFIGSYSIGAAPFRPRGRLRLGTRYRRPQTRCRFLGPGRSHHQGIRRCI